MSKDVSRLLSAVLRHKPEILKIELDENGYVDVSNLLYKLSTVKNITLRYDELETIVKTNDKKRFAFSEDGLKIRASQGHSLNVDLKLKNRKPPTILYHGTVDKFLDSILSKGLKKMNRDDVHLSDNIDTATNVGSRRGKPIILKVFASHMHMDGYKFKQSANGVWLTDHVPPKYLKLKP